MNRYFEIKKEGISVCLDNDVAYYHHFKVGEIICVSDHYKPKLLYIMNSYEKWKIGHQVSFVLDCYTRHSEKLSPDECIFHGYFIEITKGFELKELRDKKLNELGI